MSDPILGPTGASAPSGTYTFTLSVPVGTSVGDVLILDVLLFKDASFTPGTDTVTVPPGWTSLGGIPEPGSSRAIRRHYWKFASSGDLVANSIVVSFGTAWGAFGVDRRATLTTVKGGTGIVGGPHASGAGAGVSISPTMPDPPAGKPVVVLLYSWGSFSGGSAMYSANSYIGGWGPWGDSANLMQRGHGVPPFGPLTMGNPPTQVGFNTFAVSLPSAACQVFKGKIVATTTVENVVLAAQSGFVGTGSDYRVRFRTNTTGHSIPSGGSLATSHTIGAMRAGSVVEYEVVRTDGAHLDVPAVMRARDTVSGLYWDVTLVCTPGGGAYQMRRGRRVHIAGAQGVSIQGR